MTREEMILINLDPYVIAGLNTTGCNVLGYLHRTENIAFICEDGKITRVQEDIKCYQKI